jgi:hypothetical protein
MTLDLQGNNRFDDEGKHFAAAGFVSGLPEFRTGPTGWNILIWQALITPILADEKRYCNPPCAEKNRKIRERTNCGEFLPF